MSDFVTEQMETGLLALQVVAPFDFAGAYHAAYSGINVLDPRRSDSHAELIYGRSLALTLWVDNQRGALVAA